VTPVVWCLAFVACAAPAVPSSVEWEIASSPRPAAVLRGVNGEALCSVPLGSQGFENKEQTVERWRDARVGGAYCALIESTLDRKRPPQKQLVSRSIEFRDGKGRALFKVPAPALSGGLTVSFASGAPAFALHNVPDGADAETKGYVGMYDEAGRRIYFAEGEPVHAAYFSASSRYMLIERQSGIEIVDLVEKKRGRVAEPAGAYLEAVPEGSPPVTDDGKAVFRPFPPPGSRADSGETRAVGPAGWTAF